MVLLLPGQSVATAAAHQPGVNSTRLPDHQNHPAESAAWHHCITSPVLSEPELEPERVDAVEVVAEEALVPHEAKVLVQPQRRTVRYLSLQHHLR